jgi:hypothetical protein
LFHRHILRYSRLFFMHIMHNWKLCE